MTRKQMIERLVRDSLDTVSDPGSYGLQDSETWLSDIFTQGFKGFNNYTKSELSEELADRGLLEA